MPLTPEMRRSIEQIRDYLYGGGYPDPVSNAEQLAFHLILSAYHGPLAFELPRSVNGRDVAWRRWIDTALDSPNDITDWTQATPVKGYD